MNDLTETLNQERTGQAELEYHRKSHLRRRYEVPLILSVSRLETVDFALFESLRIYGCTASCTNTATRHKFRTS